MTVGVWLLLIGFLVLAAIAAYVVAKRLGDDL